MSKNKVVFFQGPGFYSAELLVPKLAYLELECEFCSLDAPSEQIEKLKQESKLFVFRGPFTLCPEEILYVHRLCAMMSDSTKQLLLGAGVQQNDQKVLCIGRGALLGLQVSNVLHQVYWLPDERSNDWTECKDLLKESEKIEVRRFDSVIPDPSRTHLAGFDPWLEYEACIVGWKKEQVYCSLMDLLSVSDRSQSPDFGYRNLENWTLDFEVLRRL